MRDILRDVLACVASPVLQRNHIHARFDNCFENVHRFQRVVPGDAVQIFDQEHGAGGDGTLTDGI